MLESFLILLAGGIMLSVCVSDPKSVTLQWLRLAGILALTFAGLSVFWYWTRPSTRAESNVRWRDLSMLLLTCIAIAGQLGFAQVARLITQRVFSVAAFALAVASGAMILRRLSSADARLPWIALSAAGVAAVSGLVLMDMLLGHAYLTASKMTIAPFRRLNLALGAALAARAITALVLAHFVNESHPRARLWPIYGLYVGTRWFVGLLVPAVLLYMAHDCIKRRSTQSATGILYVSGVLIFIGEIIALQLVRDTGLPF